MTTCRLIAASEPFISRAWLSTTATQRHVDMMLWYNVAGNHVRFCVTLFTGCCGAVSVWACTDVSEHRQSYASYRFDIFSVRLGCGCALELCRTNFIERARIKRHLPLDVHTIRNNFSCWFRRSARACAWRSCPRLVASFPKTHGLFQWSQITPVHHVLQESIIRSSVCITEYGLQEIRNITFCLITLWAKCEDLDTLYFPGPLRVFLFSFCERWSIEAARYRTIGRMDMTTLFYLTNVNSYM